MKKKEKERFQIKRKRRLLKNPYAPLHQQLIDFAAKSELDSELLLRNEYVRLENMILRGIYFKANKRLNFNAAEKEEMAAAICRVKGRSKHKASLLTPAQIVHYSQKAAGEKYVSMFPKKRKAARISSIYKEDILCSIINEHPKWTKQQIWKEMQKYFEGIPAFQVYDMLYNIGYWDSKKIVRGLPWKEFLKRFEKITWAGDFFSVDVWTEYGQMTYFTLFFIHLATQRVFVAGTTNHATSEWVLNTIKWWTGGVDNPFGADARFLIRDRDRRYTAEVDWYFTQIGIIPKVISPGAPVMNFHAEQFVRKIKHECLSHCIFLSGQALRDVINAYVEYYNTQRPNSRFNGGCIIENETHWQRDGEITQTGTLPGLLNYYYRSQKKEDLA